MKVAEIRPLRQAGSGSDSPCKAKWGGHKSSHMCQAWLLVSGVLDAVCVEHYLQSGTWWLPVTRV